MIAFKPEFIERYLKVLEHKTRQLLEEKLPDSDFHCNMVDKSDDIVREMMRVK